MLQSHDTVLEFVWNLPQISHGIEEGLGDHTQMEEWVQMGGSEFSVEYEHNIASQGAFTKIWMAMVVGCGTHASLDLEYVMRVQCQPATTSWVAPAASIELRGLWISWVASWSYALTVGSDAKLEMKVLSWKIHPDGDLIVSGFTGKVRGCFCGYPISPRSLLLLPLFLPSE